MSKSRVKKQRQTSSSTSPTRQYAEKVLSGEIIAGKWVRLACERHLRDLEAAHDCGFYFDEEEEARALRFFPAMFTVTAGAKVGEPFHLLDWMTFVVGSLFGWKNEDGLRRFRTAWIETGKGQAKSPLMGALGLYMSCFCGVQRAEVYAIANDRDQAKVLFSDAVALCRTEIPSRDGETLESRGDVVIRGTGDNAWKIEHPKSGSKFLPVASQDSISGPKPILVLGDEIHEMRTDKAITLWESAIDKMAGDPLMILGTNTPAHDQLVATERSEYFQRVLDGAYTGKGADASFAYIARVDEDDDPFEDETCWVKSLPALGVTYPIENVRTRVDKAKHIASDRLATQRLFFGVPVGSSGFWIDETAWSSALVDEIEHIGDCFLALDLSKKNDLTALTAVFGEVDENLTAQSWYWTTKDGLARREAEDRAPYSSYVEDGHLTLVDSPTIDYTFVAARVAEMVSAHNVHSLTIDPAFYSDFAKACEDIGLPIWRYKGPNEAHSDGLMVVTHSQGPKIAFEDRQLCMPHSITRMTDLILKGQLKIKRNSVTTMCAANAVIKTDGIGNQYFDKQRQRGRIDGMVTLAMAVGASKRVAKQKREIRFYA